MKKLLSLTIVLLITASSVFSSNYRYALGARLGWNNINLFYGLSFKSFLTDRSTSALDFMLSYQAGDYLINGFFEFHKESKKSSRQIDYLNFYAGPGLQTRLVNSLNRIPGHTKSLIFAPALVLGFEVGLPNMPVIFGIDVIPMYNIVKTYEAIDGVRYSSDFTEPYHLQYLEVDANLRYTF